MSDGLNTYELISLGAYFVLMLGIGVYAYFKSTSDVSEYMLGGRKLHPAVGALSAGASDMSGWMLMGLPGAIFVAGLAEAWIVVGLLIGAYLNYRFVAPRLRVYTEVSEDSITIPDYFENRFKDKTHLLRTLSALVIVFFFTLYTSSMLVAGGKLFEASFGTPYFWGLVITAGVVMAYTLFGGFLAVSLTDFVQGCIMFLALIIVPIVVLTNMGGFGEITTTVGEIDPQLLKMFSGVSFIGVISAMAWGLGYFGQPHIIVRFMAIRDLKGVHQARRIGMSWMFVTVIGALATGLFGLAYATTNNIPVEDGETIFIILSQVLFHPLISGFLLAAILAAIMSTISSQLLVASSSLTEDFYAIFVKKDASQKELVLVGRITVLIVALIALYIGRDPDSKILTLVSNAWAGLGAAFGPVIILSLFWKKMTRWGALAGMITGAVVTVLWITLPIEVDGVKLSAWMYALLPAFFLAMLATWVTSLLTYKQGEFPKPAVKGEFTEMESQIAGNPPGAKESVFD